MSSWCLRKENLFSEFVLGMRSQFDAQFVVRPVGASFRIVDQDLGPTAFIFFHEFQMKRIDLIRVVTGQIVKHGGEGERVGMINDGATSGGRSADPPMADRFNFEQRTNAFLKVLNFGGG
jgi:hypothetical protein